MQTQLSSSLNLLTFDRKCDLQIMALDGDLETVVVAQAPLEPATSAASEPIPTLVSVALAAIPLEVQVRHRALSATHRQPGSVVAVCLETSPRTAFLVRSQLQRQPVVCSAHQILPRQALGPPQAQDSEPTTRRACSVTIKVRTRTSQQAVSSETPAQTPPPDLGLAPIPTRTRVPILLAAPAAAVCSETTTTTITISLKDRVYSVRTRIKISRSRSLVAALAQIPHSHSHQVESSATPILRILAVVYSGITTLGHRLRAEVSSVVAPRTRHLVYSVETTARHKSHSLVAAIQTPVVDFSAIRKASLRVVASLATIPISNRIRLSKVLLCSEETAIIPGLASLVIRPRTSLVAYLAEALQATTRDRAFSETVTLIPPDSLETPKQARTPLSRSRVRYMHLYSMATLMASPLSGQAFPQLRLKILVP